MSIDPARKGWGQRGERRPSGRRTSTACWPSGARVARSPAGNRLKSYRTARSAFPAASRIHLFAVPGRRENRPFWREARAFRRRAGKRRSGARRRRLTPRDGKGNGHIGFPARVTEYSWRINRLPCSSMVRTPRSYCLAGLGDADRRPARTGWEASRTRVARTALAERGGYATVRPCRERRA